MPGLILASLKQTTRFWKYDRLNWPSIHAGCFVRRTLADRDGLDLDDDNVIPESPRANGVSVQTLMFRLQYLGYIEG